MLTLQAASLDWALAHVENYGDTDVFPTPFEYKAIRHDWVNVRQYLLQDVLQWQVRPHRILLSPKARYGFRIITQLDPLDFLIFTAIVKEIGSDVEAQRIEVLNKIVFSYRFSATSDGGMFDPNVGYAQFQETSKEIIDADRTITHVALADIIRYLRSIRGLSPTRRSDIGTKILALLENSIISELDYHRMWALDLFTDSTEWDNEHQFFNLLANARDMLSRRNLILAMGRAGHRYWFNTHWRNLFSESDWPRRAFLAAASCMPVDARKHWYKSVESRLDPLEKAVMRWAKANPFY